MLSCSKGSHMQILLTGGTGFIGFELIKLLSDKNIILLTRDIEKAQTKLRQIDSGNITYINSLDHYTTLDDIDAIINLAGEPIANKRWTPNQKEKICMSRWSITEKIVDLIQASFTPPSVLINGSAVGYYGDQQVTIVDESAEYNHYSFPHQVCAKWESIALKAQSNKTRVCILRTGLVLGNNGGALPMMLPPFKFGAGSRLGDGKQFMPWIHIQDMVRGIAFLLTTPKLNGYFNFSAPHPVTNQEFTKTLAKVVKRPQLLTIPKLFFNLLMGEASCLLFDSIRAEPKHLLESGFEFSYPTLQPALQEILADG